MINKFAEISLFIDLSRQSIIEESPTHDEDCI